MQALAPKLGQTAARGKVDSQQASSSVLPERAPQQMYAKAAMQPEESTSIKKAKPTQPAQQIGASMQSAKMASQQINVVAQSGFLQPAAAAEPGLALQPSMAGSDVPLLPAVTRSDFLQPATSESASQLQSAATGPDPLQPMKSPFAQTGPNLSRLSSSRGPSPMLALASSSPRMGSAASNQMILAMKALEAPGALAKPSKRSLDLSPGAALGLQLCDA